MSSSQMKIWSGVHASFANASADESVFEGHIWISKALDRARQLKASCQDGSTISPGAETKDYVLPVVAALFNEPGKTLRILDFGGGMATSYLPLRAMISRQQSISFVIVENEAVCRAGRELFADDSALTFLPEVPAGERFDIIHCGSSFHYVDDWTGLLARFVRAEPSLFIFADLPAAENEAFVTTQSFHERRIPVRFWNAAKFIGAVEAYGYDLIFKSRYRNPSINLDLKIQMDHFDERYRLDYFSQLVFRRKN